MLMGPGLTMPRFWENGSSWAITMSQSDVNCSYVPARRRRSVLSSRISREFDRSICEVSCASLPVDDTPLFQRSAVPKCAVSGRHCKEGLDHWDRSGSHLACLLDQSLPARFTISSDLLSRNRAPFSAGIPTLSPGQRCQRIEEGLAGKVQEQARDTETKPTLNMAIRRWAVSASYTKMFWGSMSK